jgi:NAD(P)-dependent dehydrogenase (short-subunit alcohol dehydrogenase family)
MSTAADVTATMGLFRLEGKIALVTGGAGIYGTHIVRALGQAGAHVVVASRDARKCDAFAQRLRNEGLRAEAAGLDLTSEASIRALRDKLISDHGHLDVLVNNAVARAGGDLHDVSARDWEDAMKVNSTGLFLACQIFSEPMQQARSGSIVNIASIYGMRGPDFSIYSGTRLHNSASYSFSKGGMINLTRYLASFLAPYHVRVNCLSPGGFCSDETPANFVQNYSQRTPLGRMADPDDIKGPVVFLASEASRYITGQNLPVDGGWTAI